MTLNRVLLRKILKIIMEFSFFSKILNEFFHYSLNLDMKQILNKTVYKIKLKTIT